MMRSPSSSFAFAAGALVCIAVSCTSVNQAPAEQTTASTAGKAVQVVDRPDGWDEYWYNGLAEVNSYEVQQERYGEMRPASEVLVFVTEPFLPDAQVKDDGRASSEEAISVFKLNRIEKFTTGIYDYSLMLSVFTPVSYDQHPHTLKATFSSQDWCGHVWQQTNRRSGKFQVETRSYFQSEGDARQSLDADYLEDELLNRVRVDPASVPQGEVDLLPSAKFLRLRHVDGGVQKATVSFGESQGTNTLRIEYKNLPRTVEYRFESAFPHKLLGWTETYKGNTLSTGKLKHSRQEPYWSQNSKRYDRLRDTLGI